MNTNVTAIQILPSSIRLSIGYVFQNKVQVLQAMESDVLPTDEKGRPCLKEAKEAIQLLLATARKSLGDTFSLGPVVAILPSFGIRVKEGEGSTLTVGGNNLVSHLDYSNCVSIIKKRVQVEGMETLCFHPFLFLYDGDPKRQFMANSKARELSVRGDAYLLPKEDLLYYKKLFDSLSLYPYLSLFDSYATFSFLLGSKTPDEFLLLTLEDESLTLSHVQDQRLLETASFPIGLRKAETVLGGALGRTEKEAAMLVHLFGFHDGDETIAYPIPEEESTATLRERIRKAFADVMDKAHGFIDPLGLDLAVPVVLSGPGAEILGAERFFSESLNRNVYRLNDNIIGATSLSFVPVLGAIKASSQPYQLSTEEASQKADDDALKHSLFGRN